MVSYFEGEAPPGAPRSRVVFFSFFSEFGVENRGVHLAVETGLMGLLVLVGIAGNAVSLVCELRAGPARRGTVGPLVANLAAAGLALPLPAAVGVAARWGDSWSLGDPGCRCVFAALVAAAAASLLTAAAISAVRLRALGRGPSRGGPRSGSRRGDVGAAGVTAAVIWALACLVAIPAALGFTTKRFMFGTQEVVVCTLLWPGRGGSLGWVSLVFVLLLLMPAALMAASHFRILQVLRSNRVRLHRPPQGPAAAPEAGGAPRLPPTPGSYPEAPRSPPGFEVATITRAYTWQPASRGGDHRRQRWWRSWGSWRSWRSWRRREAGGRRSHGAPVPARERRLRVTLLALPLVLCLSWGPIFAVMWVAEADVAGGPAGGRGGGPAGDERSEGLLLTSAAFVWALAACLAGAAANPWLYGNLGSRLRGPGSLLPSCCRRRRSREAGAPERAPPAADAGGVGTPAGAEGPVPRTRAPRGEESGATLELSM